MKKVVYVEGGGDTKKQQLDCRRAFANLFRKAGLKNPTPKVIACGSRHRAYKYFRLALSKQPGDVEATILVDSEGAVDGQDVWSHLSQCDGWQRPANAAANSAHLMVQVMESWFLADTSTLADYCGQGFVATALPPGAHVENIGKSDVLDGIEAASRHTSKPYTKRRDSFAILMRLDVEKLIDRCPHAKRLIEALRG